MYENTEKEKLSPELTIVCIEIDCQVDFVLSKGQSNELLDLQFVHESNSPRLLTNILKYENSLICSSVKQIAVRINWSSKFFLDCIKSDFFCQRIFIYADPDLNTVYSIYMYMCT